MKKVIALLLCAGVFLVAPLSRAQDDERKDAEGCKDSPLITRFPGGIINSCDNKEFDQYDFPLGTDKDGNAKIKHVEGEFHSWDISTREGVSELQIYRNMETALKSGGFQIDYTESPNNITAAQRGDVDLHREQRRLLLPDDRDIKRDEAGSDGGRFEPER